MAGSHRSLKFWGHFGGIGMAFIAHGFSVLTRRYNHAGSAYAPAS